MAITRTDLEAREISSLAPWAQKSVDSLGRIHREPPPEWRTHYQRDRDRVIHSRAFRRLEYKTQVFLNGTGDHLRTRLTHTMEVAAIARNIGRALQLNEDLCETIALAHDLGHSPFGHNGESALNDLMKDHGGFEHNRQSLRIVDYLEQKYPKFQGLNLTWEVREGLIKHETPFDHPNLPEGMDNHCSSLEAQVANLADEITYYSHDLDDGLESELLEESELCQQVRLWKEASQRMDREYTCLDRECRRYFIIRCIIDDQVRDVVSRTEHSIQTSGVQSANEVRQQPAPLVQYSEERRESNLQLREFLYRNLYFNPIVHEPNQRAVTMMKELFRYLLEHPGDIGDQSQKRIATDGLHRSVCDYIAGMTDRYAVMEYGRLMGA